MVFHNGNNNSKTLIPKLTRFGVNLFPHSVTTLRLKLCCTILKTSFFNLMPGLKPWMTQSPMGTITNSYCNMRWLATWLILALSNLPGKNGKVSVIQSFG
uniref:Uncharacterized protein n=1 Tax=Rhizophora mucronata TaxID=61149 RepID=A0A2P2PYI9_RHIMU